MNSSLIAIRMITMVATTGWSWFILELPLLLLIPSTVVDYSTGMVDSIVDPWFLLDHILLWFMTLEMATSPPMDLALTCIDCAIWGHDYGEHHGQTVVHTVSLNFTLIKAHDHGKIHG